jgi:hypothetical protein
MPQTMNPFDAVQMFDDALNSCMKTEEKELFIDTLLGYFLAMSRPEMIEHGIQRALEIAKKSA